MEGLSWDAEEKVGACCAPACGRGCTTTEHDLAEAKAELLAQTLGSDWTPNVWENLGWHYNVRAPCGRLMVHPSSGRGFTAYLGPPGGVGGQWAEYGNTPQEAIDATVAVAVADYKQIGAIIEGLAKD